MAILVTVRVSDHKNASCSSSGVGQRRRAAGEQPFDGRLAGLGVGSAVIDGLDPGGEQPVELGQVGDAAGFDLDEELDAHGGEESFDLAAALWAPRSAVHEADAQGGHARSSWEDTNAEPLST